MKQNYIPIFSIMIILLQLDFIKSYHCGFGKGNRPPKTFISMESSKRHLDTNTYDAIRIYIDTTELDSQGIDSSKLTVLKNALTKAKNDYEGLLKVIPLSKFKISGNSAASSLKRSCGVSSFNTQITGSGIDADMVIFPKISSDLGSSVIAASQNCISVKSTSKPLAGYIWINPDYLGTGDNYELFLKNTLFHEMAHILVFDPDLFQLFGNIGQITLNGVSYYTIGSEKVLEKAKVHFDCDSLTGVLLENQGSSGSANSHWEARIMLGDYMISTNYIENVVSDITLALFEDSGWYKVNYYTGGLFRFGKGRGCEFINQKCIINQKTNFPNEFCLSQQGPRCTNSHLFYGSCYLGSYHSSIPSQYQYFGSSTFGGFSAADYCPVGFGKIPSEISNLYTTSCTNGNAQYSNVKELGETIGSNSVCVLSNLRPNNYLEQLSDYTSVRAICHKMTCDFTNKQTIFTIGDQTITCPKAGGVLSNPSGFTGDFECPEFNIVCTSENYCTDISDCIDKKSTLALIEISTDSSTNSTSGDTSSTKLPENTNYDYDVKKSNSKMLIKHYLSILITVLLF